MKKKSIFAAILFGTVMASAATITGITDSADASTPFGGSVGSPAFTGSTANVTGSTFTCRSGPCSGTAVDFEIVGTGLTGATPLTITIDGTIAEFVILTGVSADSALDAESGTVHVAFKGNPASEQSYPFTMSFGAFSETIVTTSLPGLPGNGAFDIVGTLDLTLPTATQLQLPNSLTLALGTTASVPEPSALVLLGAGLGLIGLARWKKRRV